MDNQAIAQRLSEYSSALYAEGASYYRVRGYRWAAEWIRSLDQSLEEILEQEGRAGLAALPNIGPHLAYTIEQLIRTGEFRLWSERHDFPSDEHELPAVSRRG